MQPWIRRGELIALGVAQEQHPDRCRLFAQWQRFNWPILHDPINVLRLRAVPIIAAIDEYGVVRSIRPDPETIESEFLTKDFPAPPDCSYRPGLNVAPLGPSIPDINSLTRTANLRNTAEAWRDLGDALTIWGGVERIDAAIDAYGKVIRLNPEDGDAMFRLGVCCRMRYDSPRRRTDDFQAAVDHWSHARSIDPNQYIWRRRIEQYGPRLIKPYPFYDWIETARGEIIMRGETPIDLSAPLSGAETATPSRRFASDVRSMTSPDAEGRVYRDTEGLVNAEVTVVPRRVRPGRSARIHITFRPGVDAHWSNEAEPLRLWIELPAGWRAERQLFVASQKRVPESSEPRNFDFEVQAPAGAGGVEKLDAYALYHVCEDLTGSCRFLRQDISIRIPVSGEVD